METLKDIFVPYEIALKLKEIGFDEPCMAYYTDDQEIYVCIQRDNAKAEYISGKLVGNIYKEVTLNAPSYEQVFKWFREKGLSGNLNTGLFSTTIEIRVASEFIGFIKFYDDENHYEVAREQLILKLIEIYKKSSKQ